MICYFCIKDKSMKKFFAVLISVMLLQIQAFALTIPKGTLVLVRATKTIDADNVKVGDNVNFITVKPVKAGDNVLIPQGTEVNAKVTTRKNNGILGIPGEIEVSEFYILMPNNEIMYLSGIVSDKGVGRYWVNAGWVFIITLPMLFIKGNDGKIQPNSNYMLYTADDMNI